MNKSKASLFLMELILAILIFAIASAVCIQIFVQAHVISSETKELNQAVTLCSSAAELFYGFDGDVESIVAQLDKTGDAKISGGSVYIYYDEDFVQCTKEDAKYELDVLIAPDGSLIRSDISVNTISNNAELYSVSCSVFVSDEFADNNDGGAL